MLRVLLACCALVAMTTALDNGLGLTPPMGFLTWERFRCNMDCTNQPDTCISENLIKQMADAMVQNGMKAAGYEYVNIDDCWPSRQRDENGKLVADPTRFPSGMKALADYVHSKGLKLGIYEDFGHSTCGGFPGSEYYLQTDANTFAEWGIDFLKFDGCASDPHDMPYGYPIMTKFLNMTGRPIMYNCQWPMYMDGAGLKPDMKAVRDNCNLWRIHGDIQDTWDSVVSIINYINKNNDLLRSVVGPGGWNDPDMLIVGDFGLSFTQQRAQMGMWAMFAAPMLVSADLRKMSPQSMSILLNKHVIAINQDPLGDMAKMVYSWDGNITQIWTKQMSEPKPGSYAIGMLSTWQGGSDTVFIYTLGQLGFKNAAGYQVTEVWGQQSLGTLLPTQQFNVTIHVTDLALWIISPN